MERYFEELAQRRQIALDASLAVGCACLASLGRLTELHLAVARTTLDDAAQGARRLLAASSGGEAGASLADDLGPQAERLALYWRALRDIQHRAAREAIDAMLRAERMTR